MSVEATPVEATAPDMPRAARKADTSDVLTPNMDLRYMVRFVKRQIRLIAAITAACTLLALVTAFLLKPLYRSEAIVMKDLEKASLTDMGQVMATLNGDYAAALRSEMDIITSRSTIDRVIDKLNLMQDPELNSPGLLDRLTRSELFNRQPQDEEERLAHKRTMLAQAISDRLSVFNDGRSMSIHIAFESSDPKKAALIANTVAEEYLVDQLETSYQSTARVNKWLEERLGELKQKLEASEKAVSDFRESTQLIQVKDGTTVATQQMEDVNKQLIDARGQTSQAVARLHSVQSMINSKDGIDGAADVLASPLIQKLREQEAEVRRKEAELQSKYGDLHPKMIKAKAEYADIQKKIEEEVHKVIEGLRNEVTIAQAKQGQLERELQKLERQAGVEMKEDVTLSQLQREADANRALYENYLARFKQTSEQQQLHIADSRIISRAEPATSPAFPRKITFMLIGFVTGGILGLFAGYLVEYFAPGFRTAAQLEEDTGLPVIGLLPSLSGSMAKKVEDYILEKPFSAYSEILRSIRTAIHFSNVDSPPKTVMITSSAPNEGKTTLCLALARLLAKSGNRILLIDSDMRHPHIARSMKLSHVQNSLTHLLVGDRKFSQVVYNDPMMPTLDVIPTLQTPNAQEVLSSHRMREILHEASQRYDLIIIDTPPLLAVSDAAMMANTVDSTIMVVRWGDTPRESVLRTIKLLRSFGCKFSGIVMSQVDVDEHTKYGEGHYQHKYNEYYVN